MNTVQRAIVKIALIATLVVGALGMPLVASGEADPNENFNNCRGVILSNYTTREGGLGKNGQEFGASVQGLQQDLKVLCSSDQV